MTRCRDWAWLPAPGPVTPLRLVSRAAEGTAGGVARCCLGAGKGAVWALVGAVTGGQPPPPHPVLFTAPTYCTWTEVAP